MSAYSLSSWSSQVFGLDYYFLCFFFLWHYSLFRSNGHINIIVASQSAVRRQYYILLFISFIVRVRAVRLFLHNILYICGLCMYNDVGITDLLLFDLVLYNDIMLMVSESSLCSQISGAAGTPTGLVKARDHRGTSRRVCLNWTSYIIL